MVTGLLQEAEGLAGDITVVQVGVLDLEVMEGSGWKEDITHYLTLVVEEEALGFMHMVEAMAGQVS